MDVVFSITLYIITVHNFTEYIIQFNKCGKRTVITINKSRTNTPLSAVYCLHHRTLLSGFSFPPYYYFLCWRLMLRCNRGQRNKLSLLLPSCASHPFSNFVGLRVVAVSIIIWTCSTWWWKKAASIVMTKNRAQRGHATHPVVINHALSVPIIDPAH